MNGISLDSMLSLQQLAANTGASASDSSASSQVFAALLADELSDSEGMAAEATEADIKKEMIMNMCLMMCANGGADPMMTSLFSAISGSSGIDALSASEGVSSASLWGLTSDTAGSATGKTVVDAALTRLGDPYSTTLRGQGDYVDCSSLAQWAYKQAGISLPGTSVKQAKYCYDNGYTISKEELQPGDLIFWSNKSSTEGRWMNIHHVGIYAGDGKVIEAKNNTGGVVIDDIWGENGSKWKITMYARPQANISE